LLDESCDSISEDDASSSPLFKLGRSPLSVVDVTPIFVEDPPEAVFGSFVEEVMVVVEVALDSVLDEDVFSADIVAEGFEADVAVAEDVEAVVEDNEGADVVADVVLVELTDVLVDVMGGDEFVLDGVTTYEVPSPNRCPQYLLSSISSSKNISFMRKNV